MSRSVASPTRKARWVDSAFLVANSTCISSISTLAALGLDVEVRCSHLQFHTFLKQVSPEVELPKLRFCRGHFGRSSEAVEQKPVRVDADRPERIGREVRAPFDEVTVESNIREVLALLSVDLQLGDLSLAGQPLHLGPILKAHIDELLQSRVGSRGFVRSSDLEFPLDPGQHLEVFLGNLQVVLGRQKLPLSVRVGDLRSEYRGLDGFTGTVERLGRTKRLRGYFDAAARDIDVLLNGENDVVGVGDIEQRVLRNGLERFSGDIDANGGLLFRFTIALARKNGL